MSFMLMLLIVCSFLYSLRGLIVVDSPLGSYGTVKHATVNLTFNVLVFDSVSI